MNFTRIYRAIAALREIAGGKLLEVMGIKILVPKKGLEPPHPCGYMDLNHARLPIPPRWQVDFNRRSGLDGPPDQEDCTSILQALGSLSNLSPPRRPGTSCGQLQSGRNDCARIALIMEN